MALMLAAENLVVSTWEAQRTVGLARSLTDWTYLSDLAVRLVSVHGDRPRASSVDEFG